MVGWPTVWPRGGYTYTALFPTNTSRFTSRQITFGIVTFCVLAIFTLSGHRYYKNSDQGQRGDHPYANPALDETLQQCRRVSPRKSKVLGGIPGFYTLENVWFHDGSYHMYGDGFPELQEIMSGPGMEIHDSLSPSQKPDVCFSGTTILNNEGAGGGWNGLWHYYHFTAEDTLGAIVGYAAVEPAIPEPERLLVPYGMDWRDKWGLNEMIVEGMFPKPVVEQDQWKRVTGDGAWTYLERVIMVDRWSSHRNNPKADQWNKMSLPIFETPHRSGFFKSYRQRLMKHYGLPSTTLKCPKIVYIDRQTSSRKFSDETEASLIGLFEDMEKEGYGRFEHVDLEKLAVVDQIGAISDATVMIGIHGNGLTHEMWMPEDATLIEMFPPETFLRDYQSVAQVLNHQYYAVINDTILLKSEWEAHPGERSAGRTHDGTEVALSIPLIREILEGVLKEKSAGCRK